MKYIHFAILAAVSAGSVFAQLPTQKVLTIDVAQTIAQEAMMKCRADGFKNIERASDVVIDSFERLFEAVHQRCFCGEVEGSVCAFEERKNAGLANIGAMELDAVVYVIESAGGKVVDANDGIAFVQ